MRKDVEEHWWKRWCQALLPFCRTSFEFLGSCSSLTNSVALLFYCSLNVCSRHRQFLLFHAFACVKYFLCLSLVQALFLSVLLLFSFFLFFSPKMMRQKLRAVVQCDRKHIKHKHVYFFWTVRDEEAVQYFTSTFAVCPSSYTCFFFLFVLLLW